MRGIAVLLVAFVLVVAAPSPTSAQCKPQQGDWLHHYEGTIGANLRIRVTLSFAGDRVRGVYFYATQLKDIRLEGRRSADGKRIQLDELDGDGKVAARFDAEFAAQDPKGKFGGGALSCEVIVGTWQAQQTGKTLPVYLASESDTGGTLEHRYAVAGADDDEVVHRGARAFWEAIKRGDRQGAAAQVAYPITIRLGGRRVTFATAADFVARYDAIVTPAFRDAVANALPRNMFARDQGVMLGNGQVWFGPDGKVIAINP